MGAALVQVQELLRAPADAVCQAPSRPRLGCQVGAVTVPAAGNGPSREGLGLGWWQSCPWPASDAAPRLPRACLQAHPLILRPEWAVFVLEVEGPSLYQLRRGHLQRQAGRSDSPGSRNASCHPLCTIHNPKRRPCQLIWQWGFSSPFIKPREQRQPGEGL